MDFKVEKVADFSVKYRPDIDGLRALAVLSVVLFHAGVPWLPGGFVGVDIFFVISGYLITGILLKERAAGHFSIASFYVRRARRILPALFFVVCIVLFLGRILLLPQELDGLSVSAIATTLFASNFLFWSQSGYFDTSAELKPLLHTWSLAVEEQFYVLWPLVILFCYRRKWPLSKLILTILGLSFAFSCVFVIDKSASVFFLLPGRAWELLIGAGLATKVVDWPRDCRKRDGLSVLGLGLLLGSVFLLDKSMPFPGWNALIPCLGATLFILAGEGALVNRYLLCWRPLVFVGLISYSLYLWHWPMLSYVRILNLGQLPPLQTMVAVMLSFLLAIFTWRLIETPFRRAGTSAGATSQLLYFGLYGLMLCTVAWLFMHFNGFPGRISDMVLAAQDAAKDFNTARGVCHLNMDQRSLVDITKCTNPRVGGFQNRTLAVWGDSHAEALIPGLAIMPGLAEGKLLQITKTSCPPLMGVEVVRGDRLYSECTDFNSWALSLLTEHQEITTVVLAARWPVYVLEAGFGVPEEKLDAPTYSLNAIGGAMPRARTSLDLYGTALETTVELLVAAGKKVILIGAVPEMKYDIPACIARGRMSWLPVQSCGLNQDEVAARIAAVNADIAAISNSKHVTSLFPDRILCSEGLCVAESLSGDVLYYDHNHLSTVGARFVFSQLRLKE